MDVEHYLEQCNIFPSGPQGVVELLSHFDEPLITRLGNLQGGQFYLRFVNNPLSDLDVWVWWAILLPTGIVASWFTTGLAGVEVSNSLALIAALIIFMQASPIRLRIIPAALVAIFFITLEVAPIGFFIRQSEYVSVATEYLVLLPVYLIVLFYLSARTMEDCRRGIIELSELNFQRGE
jgi:hypothetical protein